MRCTSGLLIEMDWQIFLRIVVLPAWAGHDQATLTLADRRHDVDGATGNGVLAMLHAQRLVGIDRGEVTELGALRICSGLDR